MPVPPNSALQPTTVETTARYVHFAPVSVRESAECIAVSIAVDIR